MKILYYTWNEYTYKDAVNILRSMGHELVIVDTQYVSFDEDERLIETIKSKQRSSGADIIFSFNYFPDLSRAAADTGIPYVSWCFDSPLLTLESKTLSNPCNRVFLFDRSLYEHYRQAGIGTVYYMPLACNSRRIGSITSSYSGKYEHDITFLGKMYDDEEDFYSRIKYLPDYIRGYLDCVMETQMKIYGTDMISELVSPEMCCQIAEYAKFDMGPLYNDCKDNVIRFMIQKQTTVRERRRLLTVISEYYKVDHYSDKKADNIKAEFKGYADYYSEMPRIFATSRINLNITLRSIVSGIPLRVVDILGAGGFCLTNYQSEIAGYFADGQSIAWYESYEDLFEKLAYYMKNDAERERIAKNGHEIAAKEFTYEDRFDQIFSVK